MDRNLKQMKHFLDWITGGDKKELIEWRFIHDKEKTRPAYSHTGTKNVPDYDDYGTSITVNGTDGKGKEEENITHVRALFIDLDNEPLPNTFFLPPSLIASRDELHHHVYWKVTSGFPLDQFTYVQKHLIKLYHSDPKIHDLPRVMRVPGTVNYKEETPKMLNIKALHSDRMYSFEEILQALGIKKQEGVKKKESSISTSYDEIYSPGKQAFQSFIEHHPEINDGEGREISIFRAACVGRDYGLPPEERIQLLHYLNEEKLNPSLSPELVGQKNQNAEKYARSEIGNALPEKDFPPDQLAEKREKKQNEKKNVEEDENSTGREPFKLIDTELRNWAYVHRINALKNLQTGVEIRDRSINMQFNALMPLKSNRLEVEISALNYIQIKRDLVIRCDGFAYEPDKPRLLPSSTPGLHRFNIYYDTGVPPKKGELDWYHNLIEELLPNEQERNYVEDWFAHVIQNPLTPSNFALLIHSHEKGIGKSLLGNLLGRIIGMGDENFENANCRIISNDDIKGTSTRWIEGKRLIVVEEVMQPGRIDLINRLKVWISEPVISVKRLYSDPMPIKNYANFYLNSNFNNALCIEDRERRFMIVSSPATKKPSSYWKSIWNDLDGKAAALAYYLLERKIQHIDPLGRAPETSALKVMQDLNKDDLEMTLLDRWNSHTYPFDGDLVKPELIVRDEQIKELTKGNRYAVSAVRNFLLNNGAVHLPIQISHEPDSTGVNRSRPWVIRNHTRWGIRAENKDERHEITEEFNRFVKASHMTARERNSGFSMSREEGGFD